MSVHVLSPGMATTIQAGPRRGWRHLGVAAAGAVDTYSHAIANLLVGNPVDAPALEISLAGPTLRFEQPVRIALCGAGIEARANGTTVPGWRPAMLPEGAELALGHCRTGARAYLAVSGGFQGAEVMGSTSTDLGTGFGGFAGRCLARGDRLGLAQPAQDRASGVRVARWWIDHTPDLDFGHSPHAVRILPGAGAVEPSPGLLGATWTVSAASNRQGLRLLGPPLEAGRGELLPSEPVTPGTIQLPPDGLPIVLLADAQTHGGYARAGHVILADRPRMSQLRPGDSLRFVACTRQQAHQALRDQRRRLQRIALAIHARDHAHA